MAAPLLPTPCLHYYSLIVTFQLCSEGVFVVFARHANFEHCSVLVLSFTCPLIESHPERTRKYLTLFKWHIFLVIFRLVQNIINFPIVYTEMNYMKYHLVCASPAYVLVHCIIKSTSLCSIIYIVLFNKCVIKTTLISISKNGMLAF